MEGARPRAHEQQYLLWLARRDAAPEAAVVPALPLVNPMRRPLLPGERAVMLGVKQEAAPPLQE